MPREVVEIQIGSSLSYEGAASFFSVIAHPEDKNERNRFRIALCRHVIVSLARGDLAAQNWFMKPELLLLDNPNSVLKRGLKKLRDRCAVVHYIVMPQMNAVSLGHEEYYDGKKATVNNMAKLLAADRGWSSTSVPKIKDEMWKLSKPIAHAVAAILMITQQLENDEMWKNLDPLGSPFSKLCMFPFEVFLFYPEWLRKIVAAAEFYRVEMLPKIRRFSISEAATIQFVASYVLQPEVLPHELVQLPLTEQLAPWDLEPDSDETPENFSIPEEN